MNLQNRNLGDHTHAPTCKLIGGASAGPTLPLVQHAARTSRATIACVPCMLARGQHGPARQFAASTAPLRRAVGAASTPLLAPPQPPHASRAPPQHRRARHCPRRPSPRAPQRRQPSELLLPPPRRLSAAAAAAAICADQTSCKPARASRAGLDESGGSRTGPWDCAGGMAGVVESAAGPFRGSAKRRALGQRGESRMGSKGNCAPAFDD